MDLYDSLETMVGVYRYSASHFADELDYSVAMSLPVAVVSTRLAAKTPFQIVLCMHGLLSRNGPVGAMNRVL